LQNEKHDLHMISTLGGIIKFCKSFDENVDSSIRYNFDPVSNVSNGSELHDESMICIKLE
jgi:hypothetical protein